MILRTSYVNFCHVVFVCDLFVQCVFLVHVFLSVYGKIFIKSFTPLDNCPGQAGDTAAEAALAEAQVAKALAERQTRLAEQVE